MKQEEAINQQADVTWMEIEGLEEGPSKPITKEYLAHDPRAFILKNVLSEEECQVIINKGEAHGF